MVHVLSSSVLDLEFELRSGQAKVKSIKLVFVASPLSIKEKEEWLADFKS